MTTATDRPAHQAVLPPPAPTSGDRPLITIATVVRNGAATLEATIRSVAAQTFTDMEYVVVDGGSTDGTLDILRRHEAHVTTWISESDKGIYDAMNKALALARGRWLLFLGADDTLTAPDILAKVAAMLDDARTVFYGDVILKSSGRAYCGEMSTYRLMQQNICHQAIFYPAEIFRSKPYDLDAGLLADYKYNIELWGAGVPFTHVPLAVSLFEDAGASSRPDKKFESMRLALIDQHLGWPHGLIKRVRNLLVKVGNLLRR
ncbi:glycosyltransferase family 2 protein [Roseateles sp. UC29_93]|uniref:glycosyltransferase family 2 protein n=1 Tax=Roseateles sp. UC29_93 TaxID=3350177 RepID=UPI003670C84D